MPASHVPALDPYREFLSDSSRAESDPGPLHPRSASTGDRAGAGFGTLGGRSAAEAEVGPVTGLQTPSIDRALAMFSGRRADGVGDVPLPSTTDLEAAAVSAVAVPPVAVATPQPVPEPEPQVASPTAAARPLPVSQNESVIARLSLRVADERERTVVQKRYVL
jgi:hypothetical protein